VRDAWNRMACGASAVGERDQGVRASHRFERLIRRLVGNDVELTTSLGEQPPLQLNDEGLELRGREDDQRLPTNRLHWYQIELCEFVAWRHGKDDVVTAQQSHCDCLTVHTPKADETGMNECDINHTLEKSLSVRSRAVRRGIHMYGRVQAAKLRDHSPGKCDRAP